MTAGSRPLGREEIFSGNMQDTAEAFDKFEDLTLDATCGGDLDTIQLNELAAFDSSVIEQPTIYPKTEVLSSSPAAPGRSYVHEYMPARPAASYSHYDAVPDHSWTTAGSTHGAVACQSAPYAMGGQPRVSNNLLNPYMTPTSMPEPTGAYSAAGMGKAHSFPNVHTPQMTPAQPYTAFEGDWSTAQDPMAQVNAALPGSFSPGYAQRTPPYPEPPAYQFGCAPVLEDRERSSSYPGVASPWSNSVYSPPIGQQNNTYCHSNYSSPPHSLTDLSAAAPAQPTHVGHGSQSLYATAGHETAVHAHSYPGCGAAQLHFRPGLSSPDSPLSASRETSPLTFNTTEWSEVMSDSKPPHVNSRVRADNPYDYRSAVSRASSLSPHADQIPLPNVDRSQSVARAGRRSSGSGNSRRARNRNGPRSARSLELWQFLYVVLTERAGAGALMWLDQATGLFKVVDQERLSELWSDSKRRQRERAKVTRYSNLTRTLRYYYGRNLLRKGERDHVYQFLYDRMEPWISNRNLN